MDQSSGKFGAKSKQKSHIYHSYIIYAYCTFRVRLSASLTKVLAQQPFEIADIWVQLPTEPAGD